MEVAAGPPLVPLPLGCGLGKGNQPSPFASLAAASSSCYCIMSTRDRFFSSLSSAQDQLYSRLDSLAAGRPGGAGPSSSSAGTSHAQQHYGQPPGTSGSDDPLPLYARDQPSNAAHIPASVLAAPPGQAQEAYDSMPRSRLENPRVPDRERRKAAEELRRNQEMLHAGPSGSNGNGAGGSMTQEQRAMGLKTVHSYAAGSGKAILDIHTLPQRSPTFMGGSADRGRGALQGQAVLFTQDGERVSAVRLKVSQVWRLQAKSSATAHEILLRTDQGRIADSATTLASLTLQRPQQT